MDRPRLLSQWAQGVDGGVSLEGILYTGFGFEWRTWILNQDRVSPRCLGFLRMNGSDEAGTMT